MILHKLTRGIGAIVASLGLVVGFAGPAMADTTNGGSISTTGSNSQNVIRTINRGHVRVTNNNTTGLTNVNPQTAMTGMVVQRDNTTGGNAMSGAARNASTAAATVTLHNSTVANVGGGSSTSTASIAQTGSGSENRVTTTNSTSTHVTNNNTTEVTNLNMQTALSGAVFSHDNTTAGNAASGDASNTSNAQFTVTVTN